MTHTQNSPQWNSPIKCHCFYGNGKSVYLNLQIYWSKYAQTLVKVCTDIDCQKCLQILVKVCTDIGQSEEQWVKSLQSLCPSKLCWFDGNILKIFMNFNICDLLHSQSQLCLPTMMKATQSCVLGRWNSQFLLLQFLKWFS